MVHLGSHPGLSGKLLKGLMQYYILFLGTVMNMSTNDRNTDTESGPRLFRMIMDHKGKQANPNSQCILYPPNATYDIYHHVCLHYIVFQIITCLFKEQGGKESRSNLWPAANAVPGCFDALVLLTMASHFLKF